MVRTVNHLCCLPSQSVQARRSVQSWFMALSRGQRRWRPKMNGRFANSFVQMRSVWGDQLLRKCAVVVSLIHD
jgi:hypothetical protein